MSQSDDLKAQHAIDCKWRITNPAINPDSCNCELGKLRSQLAEAVEALKWYADVAFKPTTPAYGGQHIIYPIDNDYGEKAKQTLEDITGVPNAQ